MTLTLRMARMSFGYSPEKVASYCEISTHDYNLFETDSSLMELGIIRKINELFQIPLELIFIGPESKFIEHNRHIKK